MLFVAQQFIRGSLRLHQFLSHTFKITLGHFAMFAKVADGEVTRDGLQPGGKGSLGAILMNALPSGDKGFLRDILGVLSAAHFLAQKMKKPPLMPGHEFLKGLERSFLASQRQLLISGVGKIGHVTISAWAQSPAQTWPVAQRS